ncbi:MAG: hypothetical protein WAL29_12955, partial [Bacteroidales bacterium]
MKKSIAITILLFLAVVILNGQTCFTPNWGGSGFDHMNFYIARATVNGTNLIVGDEIGIFDGTACV